MKPLYYIFLALASILPLQQQAQVEGYAPSGEVEQYYKVFGSGGRPLLIINGGPGFPSVHFQDLARTLARERTIVIFDQRGTGNTKVPHMNRATINLDVMVEDIENLRKHLGYGKWDILGHSFGGVLAMSYAAKHGKRINKLVLSAAGGMDLEFSKSMPANIQSRLGIQQIRELAQINQEFAKDKTNVSIHNQRFQQMAWAYVYNKNAVSIAIKMLIEGDPFVYRINELVWQDMRKSPYDVNGAMKKFTKPVLILHGRQDVIGESVPIASHNVFPNSRLEFINEASHYIWLDKPNEYFDLINEFLK